MEHKHTPAEEQKHREAGLDETLAESFPASDPPSTLPNPEDDEQASKEENEAVKPPQRKPK